MSETNLFETETLVLAVLYSPPEPGEAECSLAEIVDLVGGAGTQFSRQFDIATSIESLVETGAVRRRTTEDGERFQLTESGRERAREAHELVTGEEIELIGETRELLTVQEATELLGRHEVAVAAACTEDGLYYRQDGTIPTAPVGREGEHEQFTELLDRVRETDRGEAVVFTGPGGVGKTTLVEQLLANTPADVETVSVRCQKTGARPYQPLRELLAALGHDVDPFQTAEMTADDNETYETQQTALFRELTGMLLETECPRIICVDDIDLADGATWEYLDYLCDRIPEAPVVLCLTHRPGTLPASNPLTDEQSDCQITRIGLTGLDRESTERLIAQTVGTQPVPTAFVDAVYERTDGTPLFVEQTVETLLANDQLDRQFRWYPDTAAEIDLPVAVRETVHTQLDLLDRETRDILEWVAVAGESASVEIICTVSASPPEEVRTVLDTLVEAGTFHRKRETRIGFSSNAVRDAIYETVLPQQRARQHETIATELESMATTGDSTATERAASIAYHYRNGENPQKAIRWYLDAAGRARDAYAHQTAIEYYHTVLDIARETEHERLLDTALKLADTYLVTGEYEQASRYVEFVRERITVGDVSRRQQTARLAAAIAVERGEYDRAIEETTMGLELHGNDNFERCRLLATKADAEWAKGEYEQARRTSRRLRSLAERIDAPDFEATAIHQVAVIAMERSNYEFARKKYRQAREIADQIEDRHLVADTQMGLGIVAKRENDYEQAQTHWEQAREAYEEIGDRHQAAKITNNLGLVAKQEDEYQKAKSYYTDALSELRALGDRDTAALVRMNLGNIAVLHGEYEQAETYLRNAVSVFDEIGRRHHAAVAQLNLGNLLIIRERYEEADKQLQKALAETRSLDDTLRQGQVLRELGYLARKRGEYDSARSCYTDALGAAQTVDDEKLIAQIRAEQARLSLHQDQLEQAQTHAESALERFSSEDETIEIARVQRLLGRIASQENESEQARERLETALETFEQTGARRDAVRTLDLLADVAGSDRTVLQEWSERIEQLVEPDSPVATRLEQIRDS